MRKLFSCIMALISAFSLVAQEAEIRDIDINVHLDTDGTANIVERWDVVTDSGTEWYLVRNNLGDIRISGLEVTDETGLRYVDVTPWDVDRSLSQKAGTCGIHDTSEGCEICWGLGSHGHHQYTVSYRMSNVIKSLNDYDMLHMQFISDELSSRPEHARVCIEAPATLDTTNARVWGFGYIGTTEFRDGIVVAESSEQFRHNSSMIVMMRFDKGIFSSSSIQDRNFSDALDVAMEGNDFVENQEEDDDHFGLFMFIAMALVGCSCILAPIKTLRTRRKNLFGVTKLPRKFPWYRDIPFKGNLLETAYVANHSSGTDSGKYTAVSAMVLRFVIKGAIQVRKNDRGKVEFVMDTNADRSWMSSLEEDYYQMMLQAAGSDGVLQEREFSRWNEKHTSTVDKWISKLKSRTMSDFADDAWADRVCSYDNLKLNSSGQNAAMNAMGFKQYLSDFTIIDERQTADAGLWGDYLVFAAAFGIAERVSKELAKLTPEELKGVIPCDSDAIPSVIVFSRNTAIYTNRAYQANHQYSSQGSSGGFGGGASFGGGGGFSGGGHGGGCR